MITKEKEEFISSFFFFLHFRYKRGKSTLQGQALEAEEDKLLDFYKLCLFLLISVIFLGSLINYSIELHISPPLEFCVRSGIIVDPSQIAVLFLLPFSILAIIALAFDTNLHLGNLQALFNMIFSQVSSSIMAILFLLPACVSLAKFDDNNLQGLTTSSLLLPLLGLKGPLMLKWHHYTESQEEVQQAHVHAAEEIEMQIV